ncbi:GH116 family glycosyl-hydrolase [Vallitalea guaymasensis]|uniref:Glucosylceramidase n=1 Tax=Vallitalea guaymasensis TaxID=1185412 RepID=A0A8J8MCD5_9FIRM|nr:GH116 family glycosyl-hydrolase [Vallitalea guaymasensis]QUH30377.1 hypothetical protein HYG85_16275 [Vallitalea guaymasensis]
MGIYIGEKTKEISFPLGGIGAGCIGLAGDGRLIDWEIFNRPNKNSNNGFTHFAVKAEDGQKVIDSRILQGHLQPPYTGTGNKWRGFGHGVNRTTMSGLPKFENVEFIGEFPIANINLSDDSFPGLIKLTAFNPFIPLNDKDSSIPASFFDIEVKNITDKQLNYTINFAMSNPLKGININRYKNIDGLHIMNMSGGYQEKDYNYGNASIATDSNNINHQEYWFRGRWFDNLEIYWREFTSFGAYKNRRYDKNETIEMDNLTGNDVCMISATISINPGETKKVKYVLSWYFPNCYNYWDEFNKEPEYKDTSKNYWKNYYSTIFEDSTDVATYCYKNWDRLYKETLTFKEALFDSTLPAQVIDALSANISILKSPTCLRLENGEFYGWEGCHEDTGSCEGSCTHVWNYAYALPFLFPNLERSMRDLNYKYNQKENGEMCFRLRLPLGREISDFRACADGQFGDVIKVYREWKISGDTDWLISNWKAVKKSIEYAWESTNYDKWDPEKSGVLTGRQHHTLDMELFGPNSWLTGFYLAALKAGAEMAEFLGEKVTADEYRDIFNRGKKWVDNNLFNGEYYQQQIDLKDKEILKEYVTNDDNSAIDSYWNKESKEIKYQIGEGCIIDQVIAQWHSNIIGLGEIFDPKNTKKTLHSLYKYNFKPTMVNFYNPCRVYCLDKEGGIVICDWPDDKYKPIVPVPYAEETMNGFEYQVATHMIQEGMISEGLEIVKAVRDRYDGYKRNPWNEFECGSNYARSMASYGLLLALSGFEFDMVNQAIGFNPVINQDNFKCFWAIGNAWGTFTSNNETVQLTVLYGKLEIKTLQLSFIKDKIKAVKNNEEIMNHRFNEGSIEFNETISIKQNTKLMIYRK